MPVISRILSLFTSYSATIQKIKWCFVISCFFLQAPNNLSCILKKLFQINILYLVSGITADKIYLVSCVTLIICIQYLVSWVSFKIFCILYLVSLKQNILANPDDLTCKIQIYARLIVFCRGANSKPFSSQTIWFSQILNFSKLTAT